MTDVNTSIDILFDSIFYAAYYFEYICLGAPLLARLLARNAQLAIWTVGDRGGLLVIKADCW